MPNPFLPGTPLWHRYERAHPWARVAYDREAARLRAAGSSAARARPDEYARSFPRSTPPTRADRERVRTLMAEGRLRFAPSLKVGDFQGAMNPENYMVSDNLATLTYDPRRRRRQSPEQVARETWLREKVAPLPPAQRRAVQEVRQVWRDPRTLAWLDVLAMSEAARYNSLFGDNRAGQRTFSDFSRHPGQRGANWAGGPSSMSGRYQIGADLNTDRVGDLGLTDMSPLTQDAMATRTLIVKDILDAVRRDRPDLATARANRTWTSLPGGVHARVTPQQVQDRYDERLEYYRDRLRRR